MNPDRDVSLAEAIDAQANEEAARRRAAGIHDAERRKRRQAVLELVEELKRPLIPGHPPTDVEDLLRVAPVPQKRHGGPGRPRKRQAEP